MKDINKEIEILEEHLSFIRNFDNNSKYIPALEHLIKGYKELEENINKQKQLTKIAQTITDESIKEALIEFEKDYIPVSLVEEKIEELNKAYEDSKDENGESEYYYPDYTIRVLEELLEKRK